MSSIRRAGARRDAGFSIFYVGISVGALLGSLLVPLAAAHFGWRWGFSLPVVGMLLGLSQFMLTRNGSATAAASLERPASKAHLAPGRRVRARDRRRSRRSRSAAG